MSGEILKEEEYLPEDDTPEPEPTTTPDDQGTIEKSPQEKKKTGRSIRSEAQLKALERGRQRAAERREAERKAKELEKAKKVMAEQPKEEQVKPPEPVKPVKPVRPASPPKPRIERKDGVFYLY